MGYQNMTYNVEKIRRDSYIWNMIAGLINASEAVVLLMVITRTNDISDAGILTLAFAVANLLMNIGKYGMRNYQVTDAREKDSFNTYFTARLITVMAMILASAIYVCNGRFFQGYSVDKMAIIFVICLLYTLECTEDVFCGYYQQKGRLDIGAKIFSYRWGITLLIFIVALIVSNNLLLSASLASIVSGACLCVLLKITFSRMKEQPLKLTTLGVKELLYRCTPLFLSGFCSFYITNASKYAIDIYLSEEAQACYGFIAMPVFVIGLVNGFLYQPILVKMSQEWQQKKWSEFVKRIKRQTAYIIVITIICMIGAYLIGTQVLSALYSAELKMYKGELLVLLFGGGLLAISGFMYVIMTIMRIQKKMVYGYLIVAIIAKISANFFVRKGGMMGAAVNYVIMMMLLTIIFVIILKKECDKLKTSSASRRLPMR